MAASINHTLEIIKAQIAEHTELNVTLGIHDDSDPGLYIFPYKFDENKLLRNFPDNSIDLNPERGYILYCLLIPGEANNYKALDKGLKFFVESPFIKSDGRDIRIELSIISMEELTSIFNSTGVRLRLAIPFMIQF